jgi:hypothetical protein
MVDLLPSLKARLDPAKRAVAPARISRIEAWTAKPLRPAGRVVEKRTSTAGPLHLDFRGSQRCRQDSPD